ncbi:Sec-independent protein translocase subunit TatA [Streptomyces sp. M19]
MLRNGLEPWHLLVVALVVILVFGSKRLPDTARALGKSLRILRSETRAMKGEGAGCRPRAPRTTPPLGRGPGRVAARTVQAAPGDAASARPVPESGPAASGSTAGGSAASGSVASG